MDWRAKKQKVYDLYKSAMVHTNKSTMLVPLVAVALIPLVWWFFKNPLELKQNEAGAAPVVPVSAPLASSPASDPSSPPADTSRVSEPPKTQYRGPRIISHLREAVSFEREDGLTEAIPVSDFVRRFPPDLYGYSYLHAPARNRFILMDRAGAAVIYPVDNVFHASQTFIASSDPIPPKSAQDHVEVHLSDRPDSSGFSAQDRAYARRLRDMLNPFSPIRRE